MAFYQTASFGDDKWRIQQLAPVMGHELTTRKELMRDEPNHPHANQDYYKIQLGPLLRLPEPIIAKKWRRITFLYTTGEYLLKAKTMHDLIVGSEERRILWQALRERVSKSQSYSVSGPLEFDLEPEVLNAILGISEANGDYNPD